MLGFLNKARENLIEIADTISSKLLLKNNSI